MPQMNQQIVNTESATHVSDYERFLQALIQGPDCGECAYVNVAEDQVPCRDCQLGNIMPNNFSLCFRSAR